MINLVWMFLTGAIWWLLVPLISYAFFTIMMQKSLKLTWKAESPADVVMRVVFGALMLGFAMGLLFLINGALHVVFEAMKELYPTP
jgi:hypothetical protein